MNLQSSQPLALITGASRGIGAACAHSLSNQGFTLCLVARNQQDLMQLQKDLPGESIVMAGSVSDADFVKSASEQIKEKFGKIDLVVLNAGVGSFTQIDELDEADYDRMMDVNVKGSFLFAKHLGPMMKEAKQGQFIFITSDVATRTFAGGGVYCASKYAQHALSDALRKELRPHGVKVGAIYPGMTATYFGDSDPTESHKRTWLQPQDIADAISYMASAPAHVMIDTIMLHPTEQEW